MRKVAALLPTIAYGVLVALVGTLGLLLVATRVPLLGKVVQLRIVQSGSMAPAIPTGSLVVIRPSPSYAVGEVITFRTPGARVPTTHRIVGDEMIAGRRFFTTKGDANEEADARRVPESAVEGKVILAIPYLGYILDFARTPVGFFTIIVVPALAVMLEEAKILWRAWQGRKVSRDEVKEPPGVNGTHVSHEV